MVACFVLATLGGLLDDASLTCLICTSDVLGTAVGDGDGGGGGEHSYHDEVEYKRLGVIHQWTRG